MSTRIIARMVVLCTISITNGSMTADELLRLRHCFRDWMWRHRNAMTSMDVIPTTAFVSRTCSHRCFELVAELECIALRDPYASSYVALLSRYLQPPRLHISWSQAGLTFSVSFDISTACSGAPHEF